MIELTQINKLMKNMVLKLEEARLPNLHFDTTNFTTDQRKAYASLITPLIGANLEIIKALAILKGESVDEVLKRKPSEMIRMEGGQ